MADSGWVSHKNPLTLLNQLIKPVMSVGADGEARVNIELDLKGGKIKNAANVDTDFVNGSVPATLDLSGELYILDENHNVRLNGPLSEFPADCSYNVALGYDAGGTESTGSRNVFLGPYAGKGVTQSDVLRITNANELDRPPLIAGDFARGVVGINKSSDIYSTLDIVGDSILLTNPLGSASRLQLRANPNPFVPGTPLQSAYVESRTDASGGGLVLRVDDSTTNIPVTALQAYPNKTMGIWCGDSTKPTAGFEVGSGVSAKFGGTVSIEGSADVSGTLIAAGPVGINTRPRDGAIFDVSGKSFMNGDVEIDGMLVVAGNGGLVVSALSLFTKNTTFRGDVTTVQGTMNVRGSSTVESTLGVMGKTTLSNGLDVFNGPLRTNTIQPATDPSIVTVDCEQLNVQKLNAAKALQGESLVVGSGGASFNGVVQSTKGIIAPTDDVLNSSNLLTNVSAMYTAMSNMSKILTSPSYSYSIRALALIAKEQTFSTFTIDSVSNITTFRFYFRAHTRARTPRFNIQSPGSFNAVVFRARTPCKQMTATISADAAWNISAAGDPMNAPEVAAPSSAYSNAADITISNEPPFVFLPYEHLLVIYRPTPSASSYVSFRDANNSELTMTPYILSDVHSDFPLSPITGFPFNV